MPDTFQTLNKEREAALQLIGAAFMPRFQARLEHLLGLVHARWPFEKIIFGMGGSSFHGGVVPIIYDDDSEGTRSLQEFASDVDFGIENFHYKVKDVSENELALLVAALREVAELIEYVTFAPYLPDLNDFRPGAKDGL